jgi:phosphoribosylformimino-5-aminoimidazole carboxamide ribotide isomerase
MFVRQDFHERLSVGGFNLIPVIDLKDGIVVHAREGRREEYQPVRSRLIPGAEPSKVVEALLKLHPFQKLYVADLDSIQRCGTNMESIRAVHRNFPELELWADTGIGDEAALACWLDAGLGRPVIGSESLLDAAFISVARERTKDASPVLSLDYQGDDFRGPALLLAHPERYWPQRVLAMNLLRVGSRKGPDLKLIVGLAGRVPGCQVYAAGGVRSVADLVQVQAAGAAGALIASALHDGRIGSIELSQFMRPEGR